MKIEGLQFEDSKITSYLFSLNNKKILFDFGCETLSENVLNEIDYIFISHYHYDHIAGLLKNLENINNKCRIYMTRTTKEVIEHIIFKNGYKDNYRDKLIGILNNSFNIALFDKNYSEDGLTFKFYRSGHCFGGYMLYIKDKDNSLFFSSDMDYVPNDINRKYCVNEYLEADYVILDGMIVDDKDFKQNKIASIKFNNKSDMRLFCKIEKAVVIAKLLSKRYESSLIVYDADLEPLISIFYRNGYDCFSDRYNITVHSMVEFHEDHEKKRKIILSSINKDHSKFLPNSLFSLHISAKDRKEFIENTFLNNPKVLLSHYDNIANIKDYCSNNKYEYIKIGVHNYEEN